MISVQNKANSDNCGMLRAVFARPRQAVARDIRAVARGITVVLALLVLLAGAGTTTGHARQSDWIGDPAIGEARLVSAVAATGDLETLPLGLEFTLAPGWKVYWRTPGEAGLPPSLFPDDAGTAGIQTSFSWPMPTRFDVFGFDNFGYENSVILPVQLSGFARGAPVMISAGLEALVCSDICVPMQGQLSLAIPAGDAAPTQHAQAIAQYAAMVPRDANADGVSASGPGLQIAAAAITQDDQGRQGLFLRFAGPMPDVRDIFVEGADGVAFKAPQRFDAGPFGDGLFMQAVPDNGISLVGTALTATIDAPPQGGSFAVVPARLDRQASQAVTPLVGIVLIALLGGLILNLMPCVLPVLALKLSAVIDAAGVGQREMRLRFLAGAAGIICSFMLLAGGLAAVRIAGGTVGWGVQFQNPAFLVVMMVLIGLFAFSLLDRIHIPVPAFAQQFGGGGGYFQDFLAGMLATVLATPCSAPFVGTAVAAALSGGMVAHFVIFAAMAAGLAAPWLLVAAFPAAVVLLPRPGRWMIWMKRVLALLLFGTVLWLATVLAGVLVPSTSQQDHDGSGLAWQMWSPATLQDARAAGIPVFVDVTADWCITCKANKALVLDRDPVAGLLNDAAARGDIVLLQADWTRPDKDIAAFLASHGRFGIPFNIIYSDTVPTGQVLSELLQTSNVMAALETAGISSK